MRVVCMCNGWLGWQALHWLISQAKGADPDTVVALVLHSPDRGSFASEMRACVPENCLVLEGSQVSEPDTLDAIRNLRPDLALSVLFGHLLQKPFLDIFPRGCLNLHPALLPYNRGAYPNVWSIVDGTPAGVTLHYMDEGLDTGDIICQKEVPVLPIDTGATLYRKLETEGLALLREVWPRIRSGSTPRRRQPPGGTLHRKKHVEEIDEIHLDRSYRAADLINVIRARTFPPYEGAFFRHEGKKVFLRLELSSENQS